MLSDKLKEKWAENCDSVVLFTWIDFLKTEAIEALGIKFPIDVSEEKIMKLSEQSILRQCGCAPFLINFGFNLFFAISGMKRFSGVVFIIVPYALPRSRALSAFASRSAATSSAGVVCRSFSLFTFKKALSMLSTVLARNATSNSIRMLLVDLFVMKIYLLKMATLPVTSN